MRLKRLSISNFKGIETQNIDLNGKSIAIYGDNALTKSSHLDAIEFMLSERDMQNRSVQAFGIKTRERKDDGSLGEVLFGLEPKIETTWILEDGTELTTKKIHREKWVKNRGAEQEKLDGYTIDYFWNGKEISYTEFKSRWNEIIDDETAKMLSMPDYVSENLSVTEKRTLLVSLIEYDDQMLVNERSDLSGYLELIGDEDQSVVVDNLKKDKQDLNKDLGTRRTPGAIDARIDENQQKIDDSLEMMAEEAQAGIEDLQEQISQKREKISQLNAGGGVADMQVKLQEIEAQRQKAKNEHSAEVEKIIGGKRERVQELRSVVDEAESNVRKLRTEFTDAEQEANQAYDRVKKVESLIEQGKAKQPEPPQDPNEGGPEDCPMCERPLPEQDPAEAEAQYNQYVERFNSAKAEELKKLNAMLEDANKVLAEKKDVLETKKTEGLKAKGQLSQRQQALEKAEAELKSAGSVLPGFDEDGWEAKKQAITKKIDDIRLSKKETIDEINAEISRFEDRIKELQGIIQKHENNQTYRDRIQELIDLKRTKGKELVEVEKKLLLIEDFNKAKAETIEGKVNKLFNLVSWRLFEIQNNGGLKEVCDAVYNSNPWQDLSTSEKIKCGIDIIETLSRHFGKSTPILIDRQESVTVLPDSDKQFITTVVSRSDKKLRIEELEEESKLAVA